MLEAEEMKNNSHRPASAGCLKNDLHSSKGGDDDTYLIDQVKITERLQSFTFLYDVGCEIKSSALSEG